MVLPINPNQTVLVEKSMAAVAVTDSNKNDKIVKRKNKIDYGDNFIPPDGGWGWIVCIASGLSNLCTVPMVQQFGLIFRDFFKLNGITNSEITTITNTYHALTAFSEFLIAPFFRWFSYRQIALLGALIITLGIYLTCYATTFLTFLIIYSIVFGFGRGMHLSAKHIAFNVYFKEKRKRGNSIIITITAIGPLFMSYLVLALIENFGLNGTILILTGLAINSFALSWVYKPIKIPENTNGTTAAVKSENDCDYKISTIKIQNDLNTYKDVEKKSHQKVKSKTHTTIHKKIVECFDLNLLKDWRYCNIIIGLTLAQFVESNFNILTPFILSDFGYSYSRIALIMTVSRIPDIISRFVSPFIVERFDWDNRVFWLIALGAMTGGEILIAQNPPFEVMFGCFIWLGIFRGLRMIFNSIIIPGYVPLKQLPAASGLQKMVSGIFMLACGPIIGIIRDASNDYRMALLFLNCLSIVIIITWTIELIYQHRMNMKAIKNNEQQQQQQQTQQSQQQWDSNQNKI